MEQTSTSTKLDFYPFAYALFDECLEKHCWYCLDDEKKLNFRNVLQTFEFLRCTGCHNAMFCDKNCQSLGWKDHKFECKGINSNYGKVPDIEVRLLGRIVWRHKAILCGVDKKDNDFYKDRTSKRKIMEIWAHTERIKNDKYALKKFEGIYEQLCRFYDPKAMLNKQTVFELHCRDFINRHAISDKHYLREIGKGLYLDLCAYDHSLISLSVVDQILSTVVNISDCSSTFYSYIDLLCTKQDRKKLLKDTWYFDCECERCLDESEQILSSMLCPYCEYTLCIFGKAEYKDPVTQLITCPKCTKTLEKGHVLEAISAMCFISDIIEQTNFQDMGNEKAQKFLQDLLSRYQKMLPPVNVYMCKIVQALLPFIDPNNSSLLLELHLNVENCLRICYPYNHPALAFHLRNIGIFAKNLNKRQQALNYLDEALKMFRFVMGEEHSLFNITKQIFEEAKMLPENKSENNNVKNLQKQVEEEIEPFNELNEEKEMEKEEVENIKNKEETEAKNKGKKGEKTKNKNTKVFNSGNTKESNSGIRNKETSELTKQEEIQKQQFIYIESPQIFIENEDKKEDKNLKDFNNNEKNKNEDSERIIENSKNLILLNFDENRTLFGDGGVKKKLLQKKFVPRSVTPMYYKNIISGENNEKIEAKGNT
ncbi:MYND-type domain-containing protein [Meloidogyne graminicola]|uniref:MYND-type domain-containing protein n=1 Tax=Meloidogyne graminicola TaxID=189291 RepID=A0A8S9ZLY6_9BILA|nr:MYND-type domain-containing protein [Meloidogyne graminicola]